jgi:hypothetical protein
MSPMQIVLMSSPRVALYCRRAIPRTTRLIADYPKLSPVITQEHNRVAVLHFISELV